MKYAVPLCSAAALLLAASAAAAQTPRDSIPSAASASPEDPQSRITHLRSRRDVITLEEIEAAHVTTAYEVVSRLRPNWLYNRGGPFPDSDGSVEIQVYYNGQHVGGVDELKRYSAAQLVSMRWIDPIRARTSYGGGNGRGVITLTSY